MERLTGVTPSDIRKTVMWQFKELVRNYHKEHTYRELGRITGLSGTFFSRVEEDSCGHDLYSVEKVLNAFGKHLEIVDD